MPIKAYLGPPGGLIPLPYIGALTASPTREANLKETIGGDLHAQLAPRVRTTWSVSVTGLRAPETAALAHAMALQGAGEGSPEGGLAWISPAAVTVNGIPRSQVLQDGMSVGGASAGGVASSEVRGSATYWAWVVPGRPVTASAWGGSLSLSFDAGGGASGGSGSLGSRGSVTATAPAGATKAFLSVSGTHARPCITLTSILTPYGAPAGAGRCLVLAGDTDYRRVPETTQNLARISQSFTITELD